MTGSRVHISLGEAIVCVDRACERARQLGAQVTAVVTDRHGDILQLDRMDGAAPMTVPVAEGKALTALNFKRPSGEVAALYTDPNQSAWLSSAVTFKLIPLPGGLPIQAGGWLIGAIGVSGAEDEAQNESIARYAIAAYG